MINASEEVLASGRLGESELLCVIGLVGFVFTDCCAYDQEKEKTSGYRDSSLYQISQLHECSRCIVSWFHVIFSFLLS